MWLPEIYTSVSKHKFFKGVGHCLSTSRKIDELQGIGHGRILAPLMYKVNVNGLLNVLSNHFYAILINGLRVSSHSVTDDISFHIHCTHSFSRSSGIFATFMV